MKTIPSAPINLPRWKWRNVSVGSTRPAVGDVVYSWFTEKTKFVVKSMWKKSGREVWGAEVEEVVGWGQVPQVYRWQWARREGDTASSYRNDFGGYWFERTCADAPHPSADRI